MMVVLWIGLVFYGKCWCVIGECWWVLWITLVFDGKYWCLLENASILCGMCGLNENACVYWSISWEMRFTGACWYLRGDVNVWWRMLVLECWCLLKNVYWHNFFRNVSVWWILLLVGIYWFLIVSFCERILVFIVGICECCCALEIVVVSWRILLFTGKSLWPFGLNGYSKH